MVQVIWILSFNLIYMLLSEIHYQEYHEKQSNDEKDFLPEFPAYLLSQEFMIMKNP